ncbi:hypothetical protein PBI_LUNAR_28 [Arthrobacter phage Lunar]|uniref:Uncharacterized protein n=3 Tax=Coralvirus coral TaxID=2734227 RepID=A0A3G2KHI2_9CAUD|nr:hypothetical protein PBI_COTE_28 [Arthrobacter phage Cote]AYN58435.1 hypothetical protein PBI_LUNAR_28 [Arthrobacter phage Lunar]AYN58577.1 hypothetical protein PBI_MELONS_28 [Arthrobacter phage Melons]
MTDRPQIARIALAVELEDGTTVRLYSGEVSGTINVETEQDVGRADYFGMRRPYLQGPPRTTITIEGIHAYLIQYNDPNATKAIEQAHEEIRQ